MKKKIRNLTDEEIKAIKKVSNGKRKSIYTLCRFSKITTIAFKELENILNKNVKEQNMTKRKKTNEEENIVLTDTPLQLIISDYYGSTNKCLANLQYPQNCQRF